MTKLSDEERYQAWTNLPADQQLPPMEYLKWLESEGDCTHYFIKAALLFGLREGRAESREIIEAMDGALEFYGDTSNYRVSGEYGDPLIHSDCEPMNGIMGNRARETRAKYKEQVEKMIRGDEG